MSNVINLANYSVSGDLIQYVTVVQNTIMIPPEHLIMNISTVQAAQISIACTTPFYQAVYRNAIKTFESRPKVKCTHGLST